MSQSAGRRRARWRAILDSFARPALAAAGLALAIPPAHGQDPCRFVQATFADSGDGIGIELFPSVGGGRVAYVAAPVVVGGTGFGRDIFLFDPATAATTQALVPPEPGLGTGNVSLSDDGRLAAFTSSDDVVPGGNPDFTPEVFLLEVPTGAIRQLTSSSLFSEAPAISGDGRRVAFTRSGLGPGGDPVFELVVIEVATGATSVITPALARQLRFDGTGNRLLFRSRADLVPGSNPELRDQIFLADVAAGTLVQLTRGSHSTVLLEYAIDSAGERVVFEWAEDLVPGQNPDGGDEAFLYEVATGRLSQITPRGGSAPGISGDGTRVLLNADDPLGLGEGPGIYLYEVRTGLFRRTGSAEIFSVDANHDGTLFAFESGGPFSPHPESSSLEVVAAICDRAVTDVPGLGDAGRLGLALLLAAAGLIALRRLA
jgi:Tol biopolymer transport system component